MSLQSILRALVGKQGETVEEATQKHIKSLQETISISIEAHELMREELTKAHLKVMRLKKENEKLKKKLEKVEKESNEKTDDT